MEVVHMQNSEQYQAVIRAIHVLPQVDRLGLSLILGMPFGTVSRIISELLNEKYLRVVALAGYYDRKNFKGKIFQYDGKQLWNYGKSQTSKSVCLAKTRQWGKFMKKYEEYLNLTW